MDGGFGPVVVAKILAIDSNAAAHADCHDTVARPAAWLLVAPMFCNME